MRPEIQAYFRGVAEKHNIIPHVRFHSTVEDTKWDASTDTWVSTIKDHQTGSIYTRRSRTVISAVGGLSIPRKCEVPGAEKFKGHLFHSAEWDHSFDWKNKNVVVLGNGCSATQFVPIMSGGEGAVKNITQFSRQAHYLSERENPVYSENFKRVMRYVPLAMRLYRASVYMDMEKDFFGFDIHGGRNIRDNLAKENREYVMANAPKKYWDHLIPKHEIGCKRKVLDTDYLACLHRPNVELIPDDPVEEITETGVRTKSGREIPADAIVLATGFETQKMLFPLEIYGERGVSLNDHVSFPNTYLSREFSNSSAVERSPPRRTSSLPGHLRPQLPQLLHHDGPVSFNSHPNSKPPSH
jgi:cation diffusion facilitator CzcD-associated flavoprotein CzcO